MQGGAHVNVSFQSSWKVASSIDFLLSLLATSLCSVIDHLMISKTALQG